MSEEMNKLVIDGQEFEVVDAAGRQRITVLENTTPSGGGLSITEKNLILQLFGKAAYSENDAGTAYAALSALWSGSYYSVTWNGTGYTKSNSDVAIESGESFTSTITANNGKTIESVTVTMGGETVTGAYSSGTITIPNVTGDIVITVTTAQMTVSSISAVYTQSGTVYDTDALNSLKADLVVTAIFPDSSTAVIPASDYTLSGTLLTGTSTVTVTYSGKTTSFNVTVTHYQAITEEVTWSGSGSDLTSSVIDATQYSIYYTLPYVEGAEQLSEGVTAESDGVKQKTFLYSDAECTELVGYYYIDVDEISQTSKTTVQRPWVDFDTEYKVAPNGYYAKVMFTKSGSTFTSNTNCRTYLNTYGNIITKK